MLWLTLWANCQYLKISAMLFLNTNSQPNGMILTYESENEIFEGVLLNKSSLRASSPSAFVYGENSRDSVKWTHRSSQQQLFGLQRCWP